jgi:hypothetical protein
MGAGYEVGAWQELRQNAQERSPLQRFRKVSEGDIAAQHQVKRAGRRLRSQILDKKIDPLAIFRLYAIAVICVIEGSPMKRDGSSRKTCCLKNTLVRASKHAGVDVGGDK